MTYSKWFYKPRYAYNIIGAYLIFNNASKRSLSFTAKVNDEKGLISLRKSIILKHKCAQVQFIYQDPKKAKI